MEKGRYTLKSSKLIVNPSNEQDPWNEKWIIYLAKEEKEIGYATFAGEKALGTVPLYVELEEEYRNRGLGTDALRMLVEWAFHFKNVYEVKASADHENDKAVKSLGKAGFVLRDTEGHMEFYSITKNKTAWTGLYVLIGIVVGIILGIVLGSPKIGMGLGLVVCISMGLILDNNAKKERELVTGRKDD